MKLISKIDYRNKCAKAINRRFSSIERRIDYEEAGLFQNAQSVRYIEKHFTMNIPLLAVSGHRYEIIINIY